MQKKIQSKSVQKEEKNLEQVSGGIQPYYKVMVNGKEKFVGLTEYQNLMGGNQTYVEVMVDGKPKFVGATEYGNLRKLGKI